MKITSGNINVFNQSLRYETPQEIIKFAFQIASRPMVSTSFGKYSAVLLHACTAIRKEVPVVWCDTGYNTEATYFHVQKLAQKLSLNLEIFTPKRTSKFIDSIIGQPSLTDGNHSEFTKMVKIEPFQRALKTIKPDVWFTNLRKNQTTFRKQLDILSFSAEGILKVSPFFYHSEADIQAYISTHNLPVEANYFDPVKALEKRECGIHFS